MFTGLIQDVGTIETITQMGGGLRLSVRSQPIAGQLSIGSSVAVNGVCQTVVHREGERFELIAVEETLKKTTFGNLRVSQPVNLELPLRWDDRLGGHFLLGHVDTVGGITGIEKLHESTMFEISIPEPFQRFVVITGSIAIDGVSLTVAELHDPTIRVAIIPHTLENTIFRSYKVNDAVNIEVDVIGKYIDRLMKFGSEEASRTKPSLLKLEDLRDSGF